MNVEQLIKILKKLPKETLVVQGAREGGLSEVESVEEIMITLNVNPDWYHGPHDMSVHGEKGVSAVYFY